MFSPNCCSATGSKSIIDGAGTPLRIICLDTSVWHSSQTPYSMNDTRSCRTPSTITDWILRAYNLVKIWGIIFCPKSNFTNSILSFISFLILLKTSVLALSSKNIRCNGRYLAHDHTRNRYCRSLRSSWFDGVVMVSFVHQVHHFSPRRCFPRFYLYYIYGLSSYASGEITNKKTAHYLSHFCTFD